MFEKRPPLTTVLLVGFALLLLRLIQLQFAEHNKLEAVARENAAKTVRQPAPRGVIYDRFHKPIVENRPLFSVQILPYVLDQLPAAEKERILRRVGRLLGETIKYKVTANEPIIIRENVPLSAAVNIEENSRYLPGVVVNSLPIRLAKHGSAASHVIGYVGEIESGEGAGDVIGKDGVEKIYDQYLRGKNGGKKIEVDVYGSPQRILESLDSQPGMDVTLTLDIDLQLALEKALGNKEGAAVVLDAKTGEILAMASYPGYDPNNPSAALNRSYHPFINRALAIYPPGSIFKVVTLAAALEEGVVKPDEVFNCKGFYNMNGRLAKCWLARGHGPVTVQEGLTWSCDVVFYELGRRLGPDKLSKYARMFGLGAKSGIDLPQEKKGNVPDKAWKEQYMHEQWYEGDSINYGIGQGFVEVTPLQMALVYAAIASGKVYQPYVVRDVKDVEGNEVYRGKTKVLRPIGISDKTMKIIRNALADVVDRATGVAVRFSGVPAAGKTGTAENRGLAHAWFICYAPVKDPEIVVAAFVAHGQHGDQASAYVARDLLKWYKENRLVSSVEVTPYTGQFIIHHGRKDPYGGSR